MVYSPKPFGAEVTPENLFRYLDDELRAISQEFLESLALDLRPIYAAPLRPRDGMIVYADGTLWNPGAGEGAYVRLGGVWVPMSGGLVQNSQSANYTLVRSDAGKQIFHPSADVTARTWTIPANSSVPFPVVTRVVFVNQNGAGVITIAITTDTMRLAGAGTTGSRTLAANGIAIADKVTSTEWLIYGTGLT